MMAPASGVWDANNLRQLADQFEQDTNGRLKITTFVAGEHPYGLTDMIQAVKAGETDIGGISGGYTSALEPRMAVLDQPLLLPPDFSTWLNIYDTFTGPGGFLEGVADDWNMQLLLPYFWGAQHIYTTFGFLEDWDSFKGKDIRVWSVETGSFISTVGGNPVTIAFGEVFTGLQTGLVDGLITSFEGCYKNELTTIAPYVTMASMQYAPNSYYVNKDSLAALPDDVRNDLLASAASARDWFTTGQLSADGMALQEAFLTHMIKAQGIPEDFRQELREASYDGIWKPWMDRAGPEGVKAFNQLAQILTGLDYAPPGWTPS